MTAGHGGSEMIIWDEAGCSVVGRTYGKGKGKVGWDKSRAKRRNIQGFQPRKTRPRLVRIAIPGVRLAVERREVAIWPRLLFKYSTSPLGAWLSARTHCHPALRERPSHPGDKRLIEITSPSITVESGERSAGHRWSAHKRGYHLSWPKQKCSLLGKEESI